MKKIIGFVAVIIVIAAAALWVSPELRDIFASATGNDRSVVYRWTDDKGVVHVTDSPPPKGLAYEEQEVLHDTNVIPALGQEKQ